MLVIKKKQMAMMVAIKRQEFALEMQDMVREKYTRYFKYYSDEQLLVWVNKQLDYFDENDIDTKTAVINLFKFFAQYGEKLERIPNNTWVTEILENKAYSADHRVALLELKIKKHQSLAS